MSMQQGQNFYGNGPQGPGSHPFANPEPKTSKLPIILMSVIIGLLVVGMAIFAALTLSSRGGTSSMQASPTAAAAAPTQAVSAAPTQADPPAAAPAAPAASNSYTYAYSGNGVTTEGFADNVFSAFSSAYASSGTPNVTVSAYSPTTGRSYTMSCWDSGSYVTCTGGNNAVVYIS